MQDFIDHWQTLVGALAGGLFALSAALVVARDARRREESSAAMLLIGNLVEFRAAGENLRRLATEGNIPEEKFPMWFTKHLIWKRPILSTLFEASMIRVMPVHITLAAHLNLLKTSYGGLEINIARLEHDFELPKQLGSKTPPRSSQEMESDARLIASGFQLAEKHASCAEIMLSQFVFGSFPTWHKIRRRLLPTNEEKQCTKLIKIGRI